jgi:nicotinate phosphoribosyltransferase
MVYKLQAFNGVPRFKYAEGKRTWPGVKQVYRYTDAEGQFAHDVVCLRDEPLCGVPLLKPLMRQGRRVDAAPTLQQLRSSHQTQKEGLPAQYEALTPVPGYRVDISPRIQALRDTLLRQLR